MNKISKLYLVKNLKIKYFNRRLRKRLDIWITKLLEKEDVARFMQSKVL